MPTHRGAHPEDAENFSASQLPTLRAAVSDLAWLRGRGYGDASAIKLVGDRYQLTRRQRDAVARSACTDAAAARRSARRRLSTNWAGAWIAIDGFNVLITVEGGLGGAYLLVGRDGAYRDVDPVRGTYRPAVETTPAIEAIRDTLVTLSVRGVTWWLDAHVSNVGRLKTALAEAAPDSLGWELRVEETVDEELTSRACPVATSDSDVLDQAGAWCSIEHAVFGQSGGDAHVRDLRPRQRPMPGG